MREISGALEKISVFRIWKHEGDRKLNWGVTEGKERRVKNLTDNSEKPLGEWNSMTIECIGNAIKVWVNNDLVNDGFDATASKGNIALQAEGSEVEFRKVILTPIKKFTSSK